MSNIYDDTTKVVRTIESCTTLDHMKVALKMYQLLRRKYKGFGKYPELQTMVVDAFNDHELLNWLCNFSACGSHIRGCDGYVISFCDSYPQFDKISELDKPEPVRLK